MSSSAGRRCYILFQCFPTDVTRAVGPDTLTPPLNVFADPFSHFILFCFLCAHRRLHIWRKMSPTCATQKSALKYKFSHYISVRCLSGPWSACRLTSQNRARTDTESWLQVSAEQMNVKANSALPSFCPVKVKRHRQVTVSKTHLRVKAGLNLQFIDPLNEIRQHHLTHQMLLGAEGFYSTTSTAHLRFSGCCI